MNIVLTFDLGFFAASDLGSHSIWYPAPSPKYEAFVYSVDQSLIQLETLKCLHSVKTGDEQPNGRTKEEAAYCTQRIWERPPTCTLTLWP